MKMQFRVACLFWCLAIFLANTAFCDEKIDAAEPTLKFAIVKPKENPTLTDVNEGRYYIILRLTNICPEKLVVWPFLNVKLFDREGTEVPYATYIGRYGGREDAEPLIKSIPFVTLDSGKSHDIKIPLNFFEYDSKFMTGWNLPAAGEYAIQLRYHYDPAAEKKFFGEDMELKKLDDKSAPWNRAVEIDKVLSIPLIVK